MKNKILTLSVWLVNIILIVLLFVFLLSRLNPEVINQCGNNICEFREETICSRDCPQPICGNNVCENNEEITCPTDCKNPPPPPTPYCGDDVCQNTESKNSCPRDCGLPFPICNDGRCEVFNYPQENIHIDEFLVCPQDCGIICGDGECVTSPFDERIECEEDCGFINAVCGNNICEVKGGIDEFVSCPQDCGINEEIDNNVLIYDINQKQRPLVGGLSIEMPRGETYALCTLGAIVKKGGTNYILTAGHCVTDGTDGFPDPDDIGLKIKQGGEIVGSVYQTDFTGGVDVALISINSGISSSLKTFLGDEVLEFGTASMGLKVFKIGRTTGLTYGTITDRVLYTGSDGKKWEGFEVTSDNGKFSEAGDSGSAIITVSTPHKIVGILSAGTGSNLPEDIKSRLGL